MQEYIAFGILIFISYLSQVAVAKCPSSWYSWRDSCYIPLEGSHDWLTASETCHHRGSFLMVPNSLEEHIYVMSLRDMLFMEHSERPLWIGCEISDGKLKCLGEADTADIFANWLHEPSPHTVSGRECVLKGGQHVGYLFLDDCNLRLFAICEMQSVSVYCVSPDADGRVTPQCLLGHEIKNLTVKGVSECGRACWAEPRCHSFNLWQGGQPKICQLNDVTRQEVSDHGFTEVGSCFYYDL